MPAPIVGGLVSVIEANLNMLIWDGEVPRYTPDGTEIVPPGSATVGSTSFWPPFQVKMSENGLERINTFNAAYKDEGPITIIVHDQSRNGAESGLDRIENYLLNNQNWAAIPLIDSLNNSTYNVFDIEAGRWTCVQEENVRFKQSGYSYRAEMEFHFKIHGEVPA